MSDTWTSIYSKLAAVPGLCDAIGMAKGIQFVRMAARLKNSIIAAQPPAGDPETPPERLPLAIETFLGSAIDMHPDFVHGCWTAFSELVWGYNGDEKENEGFQSGARTWNMCVLLAAPTENGTNEVWLAMHMLFPPTHQCTTAGCTNTKLLRTKSQPSRVVYYTLANGACPAFAHRFTCDTCGTRYYPNYRVNDHVRTYYEKIPNAIQVGEHQYLETIIVNLFINLMLISWTSATNGARIYDQALSQPENIPREHPDWATTSFKLRPEHVWNAFIVLCLLEDHQRRGETLRVPHTGGPEGSFYEGDVRSECTLSVLWSAGLGPLLQQVFACVQERRWNTLYAISFSLLLFSVAHQFPARIHVIVADGITIGHPCCGVRHCTVPLASNRDRYCPDHVDEEKICAVETCRGESEHEKGFQTCSDLAHRYLELMHRKHDKAFFQLSARVARPGVSNPKTHSQRRRLRARSQHQNLRPSQPPTRANALQTRTLTAIAPFAFGRRKSHNEQIFLRSCAVIVAHRTFYGSETVPQMAVTFQIIPTDQYSISCKRQDMLRKTFRHEGTMPEIVIYDNNCTLYKHLASIKDPLIDKNGLNVGFPVDVFHWECKHKKEGIECSYHCNPRLFPELLGENGKAWFFNSSVAEQTNVWLGGFHSILREMGAVKYNFFLDEMIMRKNRITIAKLEAEGACPGTRPFTFNPKMDDEIQ
ncbi:hypothetical protein HMN09_00863800 [Mycena chlorophos]|uniref:C2H2-type domain-containing protein n=1 Tax=Mycena chlorophos TaxID=658473 RepID=A0A8H6ST43_MYCCL|nr:hypothetical protein HMN09_00863800 [Mycena chlorophos]